MVRGFQGEQLGEHGRIAACAKHFAGYGAVEGGMDYSAANIPDVELRNVYLPPFKAALDAGVATFMASFSDLNGVPASGNEFLMQQVLRREWGFEGFVVSDWESIKELTVHGYTEDDRDAAAAAARVGSIEAYQFASKENIQTHGGIGFTWESDCHLYYRRAKLLSLTLGSARIWKDRLVTALEARTAA